MMHGKKNIKFTFNITKSDGSGNQNCVQCVAAERLLTVFDTEVRSFTACQGQGGVHLRHCL